MAQITDNGYVIKTQNEWFAEEEQLYRDIDPNWNLDPSTPDGLKIAADAETFANLDELTQRAYNSKDPNKASRYDLDVICALTGTVRNPGTFSTVTLTCSGVSGTLIEAGKIVQSTADGSLWAINSNVTIGSGGTASATATCTVRGATTASIGTITRIQSTVGGWASVTNPAIATPGQNPQTDASLRVERKRSVSRPGSNQIDNMIGELFAVPGVLRVVIPENDTGTDNFYGNGLPKNSIAPIVDGGTDADVALAIFRKKNPGCALYAAGTPVTVPDVYDRYSFNKKTIKFSRPIYVDMEIVVVVEDDGTLPANAAQLITEAIIKYSTGDLIEASAGFNPLGFDIGEEVPVSRMYTPVNQVIGQYGNSYISTLTVNGLATGQVTINFNQLSRWTSDNISVTINA